MGGEEGRPNGEAGSVATFFPKSHLCSVIGVPVGLGTRETVPYDTFFYFAKRMSMELYVPLQPYLTITVGHKQSVRAWIYPSSKPSANPSKVAG